MTHRQTETKRSETSSPVRDQVESSERAHRKGRRERKGSVGASGDVTCGRRRRAGRNEDTGGSDQSTRRRRLRRPEGRRRRQGGGGPPAPHRQIERKSAKGEDRCRSRRPAVLRRLHAIDATRVHQTRSWVVSFSSLRPFGPRRVTAMLRAGIGGCPEADCRKGTSCAR